MSRNGQPLPSGWAAVAIEDIFAPLDDGRTLHQGWSPQCEKTPSLSNEEWGVLKTTSIQPGTFLPEHNKLLPKGLTPRSQIEVKSGDVLITCAGPRSRCGIACLVRNTRPCLMMSGKMYRFRVPEEQVDPRFVEAYLQTTTARDEIDLMKTGGSDSGLNLTHNRFRTLHIPLAPLNEQRRIVEAYEELLSDLDAGIAALERVRAKLKLYRASILKAAVEGALTAEWRAQHPHTEPASELLTRIVVERRRRWEEEQLRKFKEKGREPPKDWKAKYKEPVAADAKNLSDVPKGWSWTTVDQLIVEPIVNGISVRGSMLPPGIAALRLNAMTDSGFDYGAKRYLPLAESDVDDLWVRTGDFFVSRGNGSKELVGRGTLAHEPPELIIFPDTMMRLRFGAEPLVSWFSAIWASSIIRIQIQKAAKTTAGILKISQPDLARIQVPLPPLAEQEAIIEAVEDQLSVIDHLEADLDTKLKSAQALRQSILRHAFTGKLVPQDPNDEPVSALLKRIAAEREVRAREAAAVKQAAKKSKTSRRRVSGLECGDSSPLSSKPTRRRRIEGESVGQVPPRKSGDKSPHSKKDSAKSPHFTKRV
jgi:type I restriction enzyme S subunit